MNLVIGSTGVLGMEICRLLRDNGESVRGLVRHTASPERKEALRKWNVEFAEGDLRNSNSLSIACKGIDTIFSTATSIVSQQPGDSLTATDSDGHLALIDVAEKAGVQRFVFISFPPMPVEFPLQTAKRKVEERLKSSKLDWISLQPTYFQEVWLSPHLGFDPVNASVRIYGTGTNPISWISFRDVAKFAVMAPAKAVEKRSIPIGGPEALSMLDVVSIFEGVGGKKLNVTHVPDEALKAQYDSAGDPIQKSFTALMLSCTGGGAIEMKDVLRQMPVKLQSVRQYASSIL
jgi:NADH dehydrogenase